MKQYPLNYFDSEFFWKDDSKSQDLINEKSKEFLDEFPEVERKIINKFQKMFPKTNIYRYTYFLNEDRCLPFLIELENGIQVVFAVSIFKYFIAWQLYKDQFNRFINPGQNILLDLLYNEIIKHEFGDIKWLEKEELIKPVPEFTYSIPFSNTHTQVYYYQLFIRF